MMKIFAGIILLYSPAGVSYAVLSHCNSSEQALFSCQLVNSDKIVSLCASSELSVETGYLQYRSGRTGDIDTIFPESMENTQSEFFYNHYFRFHYDLTEVTFRREGNTYVIYDYYNGEEDPLAHETGVSVNGTTMDCDSSVTNNLMLLDNLLECDKENTNIGNCE